MRKSVMAAVAAVLMVTAVLPVAAQNPAPEAAPERNVACRAVDAERAFKVARAGYQNAHDRIYGTPYPGAPRHSEGQADSRRPPGAAVGRLAGSPPMLRW